MFVLCRTKNTTQTSPLLWSYLVVMCWVRINSITFWNSSHWPGSLLLHWIGPGRMRWSHCVANHRTFDRVMALWWEHVKTRPCHLLRPWIARHRGLTSTTVEVRVITRSIALRCGHLVAVVTIVVLFSGAERFWWRRMLWYGAWIARLWSIKPAIIRQSNSMP